MAKSRTERVYRRESVICFRTTGGPFGGLSNMAPGFPVVVNGIRIRTVEALYQALRFPHNPDAQRLIIEQHSPMTAKMVSRRYLNESRSDWDEVKVAIMRWCLRLKLAQNWGAFSRLLLKTEGIPIVENSRKDSYWGALPKPGDQLEGQNVLGRLLMELREKLKADPKSLRAIPSPQFAQARLINQELRIDASMTSDVPAEPEVPTAGPPINVITSSTESMSTRQTHLRSPKRLIEVDLPVRRISAHARREKDMRRGHIPLLHIYPAARPPAACRAVICAALWPDPVDITEKDVQEAKVQGRDVQQNICPPEFREFARNEMLAWTVHERQAMLSSESRPRFENARRNPVLFDDPVQLRCALLDFIADYSSWDSATNPTFIETARRITSVAHRSLSSDGSDRPLLVDSFAGGGAIPLEAARLGLDVFASDTSPVATLLNKVILELVPLHGDLLVTEVKRHIDWVKSEAERQLRHLYPVDSDGAVPTTYLWARTVTCEGPSCGATIPLLRSQRLVRKGKKSLYLKIIPKVRDKKIDFEIVRDSDQQMGKDGTVRRGSVTCPICGYTTPVEAVRRQLIETQGGARNAQLLAVATTRQGAQGRKYRLPTADDLNAVHLAVEELSQQSSGPNAAKLPTIPNELISLNEIRRISVPLYGMTHWGDLFTPRQSLALRTFCSLVKQAGGRATKERGEAFGKAVQMCLALLLDKLADMNNSLCVWQNHAEIPAHLFGRWAIGMVFDFAETNPLAQSSGSPEASGGRLLDGLRVIHAADPRRGHAESADAAHHPLPDDSAHVFMVDPPYYDAIPYAHLMDFFYVWLRRCLGDVTPGLFSTELIPKESEIVVDRPHQLSTSKKDVMFYERELTKAFGDGRRILQPTGIGVVVFASKTTASWEAILQAIVESGWIISGSWPIDTEMNSRVAAQGQARLASSVHLVCRPRENSNGTVRTNEVGDWRDVLAELPRRIHDWMPRLAEEGVVGADAIFACLGPALEIFSRYSRVEKASGEVVTLKEYLEYVWVAISKEALSMVFEEADATGFEEDARLTAMWLWTLNSGGTVTEGTEDVETSEDEDDVKPKKSKGGYALEYDAARKIAQGLGVHLEDLMHVVEVSGETARLLPVSERTSFLFGKDQDSAPATPKGRKRDDQLKLFEELTGAEKSEESWGDKTVTRPGDTILDRVHQSMILFAAGRGEALRRFLVDDGAGRDQSFWRLAQALSALYPKNSTEKRWVDGVLARKKGLGL